MGFLKDSLKVVNEIVTLGGASRFEEAKASYDESFAAYQSLYEQATEFKTKIDEAIAAIGNSLTSVTPHLAIAERLMKRGSALPQPVGANHTAQTLTNVQKFNSGMNIALSAGAGSIAGGTMAVGAWSLVTLLGSASTGAAISTLSGAAATNATLAWFGGGSLAAGGAGVAGGMTVIGGIIAIPLVYFAAKGTHKRAEECEKAKLDVDNAIIELGQQLKELPAVLQLVKTQRIETERRCSDIIEKIRNCKRIVEPWGLLTRLKQTLLILFGKNPYSLAQAQAIDELTTEIGKFVDAFNKPTQGGDPDTLMMQP